MNDFNQDPNNPEAGAAQPAPNQAPPPYQAPPTYAAEPALHVPSLIVGIIAIVLSFTTGIGGVILGIIGIVLARKNKLTHKTTIGFVLSLVGLIIGAIVFIIALAALAVVGAMGLGLMSLM